MGGNEFDDSEDFFQKFKQHENIDINRLENNKIYESEFKLRDKVTNVIFISKSNWKT